MQKKPFKKNKYSIPKNHTTIYNNRGEPVARAVASGFVVVGAAEGAEPFICTAAYSAKTAIERAKEFCKINMIECPDCIELHKGEDVIRCLKAGKFFVADATNKLVRTVLSAKYPESVLFLVCDGVLRLPGETFASEDSLFPSLDCAEAHHV